MSEKKTMGEIDYLLDQMNRKEASQKTQELLGKVPSKPMTLGDWRRWWLKVEDSDVVDAFNVKLISVEGLVDTLEILEERESKKIADLESSLEELSYSKEPEDKKLIAELTRTKSKHFGLMMAYVNIQGLVGVEAKKQK